MLNKFIEHLEAQAVNGSIYVWGAQGEGKDTISEEWIKKRETDDKNAARAIAFWKRQIEAGHGDTLRAFDCSGLGMAFLQNESAIVSSDMSAHSMFTNCKEIKKADVRRGDWVFKKYTSGNNKGKVYHVGYVVDDDLNVIEAKGRDEGVVKSPLSAGKWNTYGRPQYFAAEIAPDTGTSATPPAPPSPPAAGGWEVARVLKVTKPLTKGDDVKALQNALIANNYHCGRDGADGVFGKNTAYAVRCFQSRKGLIVDGKAGKFTVSALGGTWKE